MECQLCGLDTVTSRALVAHWKRAHNLLPEQVKLVMQGVCLDCGQAHDDMREEHGLTNHDIERLVNELKGQPGVYPISNTDNDDGWPGQYL